MRGKLLNKLANLIEEKTDEFAALEALNVGMFTSFLDYKTSLIYRTFLIGKIYVRASGDVAGVISCLRYYAGWADKVQGKTIEVCTSTEGLRRLLSSHHRPMRIN